MKKILAILMAAFSSMLAFNSNAEVVKASFPGGDEALNSYLKANMKYPERALNNGIEGVVDVMMVVKADGSIGTIKIVRMIDPDLEQEAMRLVKTMPTWNPATDNGSPIDSQTEIKIDFVIE